MTVELENLVEMYKKMLLIRHLETKVKELYSIGKLVGFLHFYIGEEAVAVGVCENLRKDDYVLSTHRGHGHCIAKGMDVNKMMAELFGKETGCCKGKGGSMHLADVSIGFLGTNGIVGAGLPLSVGVGLSIQMRGTDQVAVCFFGDGAVDQGIFHESLNLASLWKLPVVFVCENNLYMEGTHISRHLSLESIADFASQYRIPTARIDGNDVVSVYMEAFKSVKRAREGKGPSLLEGQTYRWEGHCTGDQWATYRSKEEVEQWKRKCPIERLKNQLSNAVSDEQFKAIEAGIAKEVEEAVNFAEKSSLSDPREALHDVFTNSMSVSKE